MTEKESRNVLGKPVTRLLGVITLFVKNGRKKDSLGQIAKEWQRMFPSPKMVPIVKTDEDAVFAEIRTACPYRGSSNVEGCHRMMEYDRKLLEAIGADFVVLRSQAEVGVEYCKVAITNNIENKTDLIPAHKRDKNNTEIRQKSG